MRIAKEKRKTSETEIVAEVNLDGSGSYSIDFPSGLVRHMLELFSKHSLIDINLKASGDTDVDLHHTVEDCGIVLGKALNSALGDRQGIERYGYSLMPMDESRCDVCLDLGGRANLVYNLKFPAVPDTTDSFDYSLLKDFFKALSGNSRSTIHLNTVYCDGSAHHMAEAAFKGFARALRAAVKISSLQLPSTKGII